MQRKSWPNVPRIFLVYLTWLLIVAGAFMILISLVAYPMLLLGGAGLLAITAFGIFFSIVDLSRAGQRVRTSVAHLERLMRQLLHQHG